MSESDVLILIQSEIQRAHPNNSPIPLNNTYSLKFFSCIKEIEQIRLIRSVQQVGFLLIYRIGEEPTV